MILHDQIAYSDTLLFLRELRQAFAEPGGTVVVDFSETVRLMPGATLLFFAELERLFKIFPGRISKIIRSPDATVNQVLEHLGVYSKFGYSSGVVPDREDVINWRVVTSTVNDGPLAGELIEMHEKLSQQFCRRVFRGVSEAIPNVVEHAYIGPRLDGLPSFEEKRWWMFCRESENRLYVGVCDLGVGIPASLPRTFGESILSIVMSRLTLGKKRDDALMIRAAMEMSRTRTRKDERGKGMRDASSVVDNIVGAELYIFSNRGMISYINGIFRKKLHSRSILGTLVIWIIPIGDG